MRAAIQAAVPALDDDVAEYIAGSVVVASEDMDEPQPISAERVEDLIAPFLEEDDVGQAVVSALSGAIALLFAPAAEPKPPTAHASGGGAAAEEARSAKNERLAQLSTADGAVGTGGGGAANHSGNGRANGRSKRRNRGRGGGRGRGRGRGASERHPLADSLADIAAEPEPEPEPEREPISEEDRQQQVEEAELLESIFGSEAFHRCGPLEWEIDVQVACPAAITVEWLMGAGGAEQTPNTFSVAHLPPLTLGFERSPGYPSQRPPQFTLRCLCKPSTTFDSPASRPLAPGPASAGWLAGLH